MLLGLRRVQREDLQAITLVELALEGMDTTPEKEREVLAVRPLVILLLVGFLLVAQVAGHLGADLMLALLLRAGL
jgi:hypothetical protein